MMLNCGPGHGTGESMVAELVTDDGAHGGASEHAVMPPSTGRVRICYGRPLQRYGDIAIRRALVRAASAAGSERQARYNGAECGGRSK